MADSVQYAVSMTPVEQVTSAEDGTITSNIMWPGTGGSLGGGGSYDIGDIEDSIGYNIRSEEQCDMFKEGIIDPTRVTRTALEKAASVAGTILTTECILTNIKEDNKAVVGPGQMPMM